MPSQKLSKNLPKRAGTSHPSHARRQASYARGIERKAERIAAQKAAETANRAAGKPIKRRKRKHDNMKYCDRCGIGGPRLIVAGSICMCRAIGAERRH